MDFKGQYYCERLFQILVVLFGIVGFIVGYLQQDFRLTFLFLSAGGGISAVVCNGQRSTRRSSVSVARCSFSRLLFSPTQICLPDWPWWNRHPLEWLEPLEEEEPKEKVKKVKKDKTKKEKAK